VLRTPNGGLPNREGFKVEQQQRDEESDALVNAVEGKRVQIINANAHDIFSSTMDSSELYHVKQQFFLGSHF